MSSSLAPALKFVMQPARRSVGIEENLADGMTAGHTPWFTEVALDVTGVPGVAVAVVYVIPKDADSSLLGVCIDETFGPLFSMMSGADFGDAMTALVAQQWPDIDTMLMHGQRRTPNERMMAKVRTVAKVQWVVADELRGSQQDLIDPAQVEDLILAGLQTVIRAASFPTALPGVIQVLGGPDRMSRRLKAMSTLFTSAAGIGSSLTDGVKAEELVDLAKDAREFVLGLRDLKD